MELKFEERSYVGRAARPQPEIHLDSQTRTLIVATPWGPRSAARKVVERMNEYLALARDDREATSPFARLSCLSTQANNLRTAALLANDHLYQEENTEEYRAGVELFAMTLADNEAVWIQCGNPNILLARKGRTLLPLGSQIDLSFDMSEGRELLPPLPARLLGLDQSVNLCINSFRARAGDRLVLVSHSHLPELLYGIKDADVSLDGLTKKLATSSPDVAFWLGVAALEENSASLVESPLDQEAV